MLRSYVVLALVVGCGGGSRPGPSPSSPAPTSPSGGSPVVDRVPRPAVAQPRPAQDTYHGVTVEDPYQWLEGEGEDVKEWSAAQDRYARQILDQLPDVAALRSELTAILKAPVTYYGGFRPAGGALFGFRKAPDREQGELIVLADPARVDTVKVLLDPTAGGNTHRTIDWFVPAPDGSKLAVSISEGGSENGTLHIIDRTGKDLEPTIPNVQRVTGGGDVAWTPDSMGFYYTRYPSPGEKPEAERDFWMQVWFHQLGTPVTKDRYEIGKEFPKIAEVLLETDARGRLLARVQNGDGGTFQHYLRDPKGRWRKLSDWDDKIVFVGFGPTSDLWLISRKDAPRGKILRLPGTTTKNGLADAKVIVPEGDASVFADFYSEWGIVAAGDRLFVTYQTGGPSEIRVLTLDGKPAAGPALPPVSTVGRPTPTTDGVLLNAQSYTTQWSWYRFSTQTGQTTPLPELAPKLPVDLSSFDVIRETATSKDGTKVPLAIVWPKGAPRDGSVPCLATGYGGYNINQTPRFLAGQAPLLKRGVCYVDVVLRGGGEFGEEWHQAGARERKQNVFDDFAAALAFLAEHKYTSAERLAIIGGSNGGLLMGAIITQHPELVKAVVARVGIFDMLRVERSANGAFNIPEYGTVADPDQFKALYAYSPYHHVTRRAYPAVLFTAGANDGRVAPWHSRKMTAKLQAANTSRSPILMRVSSTSGHGAGTDTTEVIESGAQVDAFILWQLGVRR
jgi:prolyl oligopeptidase